MTEEDIEMLADDFATCGLNEPYREYIRDAYIAGAKANAPVWHDLRKNPYDLPNETEMTVEYTNYRKSRQKEFKQFRVIKVIAVFQTFGVKRKTNCFI